MTKTKAELRQAHGTPVQFRRAVNKAIAQGTVGITEGQAAVLKYNREYAAAPDEHGLVFTGESVSGIMAGTKTMTRRIVAGKNASETSFIHSTFFVLDGVADSVYFGNDPNYRSRDIACPYGKVGDRLYVKETWAQVGPDPRQHLSGYIRYKADEQAALGAYGAQKWKNAMFMPRWASRLTLEITGVRVERLQGITEEDALAEGVQLPDDSRMFADEPLTRYSAKAQFAELWNELNGKRTPWKENPFVWVISFKMIESHPITSIANAFVPMLEKK